MGQVDDRANDEEIVLVDAMCWMKERSILIEEMGSFFSEDREEYPIAEVVDSETDAEDMEFVQDDGRPFGVGHDRGSR